MNPLSAEERRLVDDLVLECLDQPDELQSSWLDNLEAPSAIVAAVRHRLEAAEAEDVIDRVKGKLAGAVVGISGGVIDSYRLVRVFAWPPA